MSRKCVWLLCVIFLAGCKKNSDMATDSLQLKYNGQTYTFTGFQFEAGADYLKIVDQSTFPINGFFMSRSCGVIVKDYCCQFVYDLYNYQPSSAVCDPFVKDEGGNYVDSTLVFKYTSGELTSSWSNCHKERVTDIFSGGVNENTYCTLTGNFSMTATNGRAETISVSGTFVKFNAQKY